MKINKAQRRELERALDYIQRAKAYLMQDVIHVCRRNDGAITTDVFERKFDNAKLVSLNKEIGSDLAMLHTGVNLLSLTLESME